MLDIVCFKWKAGREYRSTFKSEHVNTLYSMLERHYSKPFRFSCITDDKEGLDGAIRYIPLWDDFAEVPSPHGNTVSNPSCYRRLKLFAHEARDIIGDEILNLDLDVVITASMDKPWTFPKEMTFKAYGERVSPYHYNGSMFYLKAGTHTEVYNEFDPDTSPKIAKAKGYLGSDQAWMSCRLPKLPRWNRKDGIYRYTTDYRQQRRTCIYPGQRMCLFYGGVDPWSNKGQALNWVREHYR